MKKNNPSEALFWKKIILLRQQFKLLQKEERIYKKRNRKLANKIQFYKEQLKELDDEKVNLQKEAFDQQYEKNISGAENITLHNNLSSVLKDVHILQTKIIGSWRENHVEKHQQSSRKDNSSEIYSLPKDQRVSESKQLTTESDLFMSQDNSQCLENVNQVEKSGTSNSFYIRETVLLERESKPEDYKDHNENDSPVEDFHGFVEDFNTKTKFTEMIEKLSSTCDMLDSLRDNENAKSLTVIETIPETSSALSETRWLKEYNIQTVEVSVPKLNLEPLSSSNGSFLSIENVQLEKEGNDKRGHYATGSQHASNVSPDSSSQGTASHAINNGIAHAEEVLRKESQILSLSPHSKNVTSSPKRSPFPDSASDPLPNGREPRRARRAIVSYKEKSLNVKLRRN